MSATISRTFSAHWRDRVEVVLARALDEAEVVRELADGGRIGLGLDRCEHGREQPVADLARALEVLLVDALDERRVLVR